MADFEYLYADVTNAQAVSPNGSPATFNWVAGQTVKYALKFRQTSSAGTQEDVLLNVLNLRAALGREGEPPESGWYRLKIGSNSTPRLDWSADALDVEAALNSIEGGPGDFECDEGRGAMLIRRAGGEEFTISAVADGLRPASYARIVGGQKVAKMNARLDLGPVRFTASLEKPGESGNAVSIEYIKPAGLGSFSIQVVAQRVIVNLATVAVLSEGVVVGYDVSTTHTQIVAALTAHPAASALLTAAISPQFENTNNNVAVGPLPRTFLSGGVNGSGYEVAIAFLQAPVAFSDWAGSELPPAPTIQKIQPGGRTPGWPPVIWPTIQALYVPPDFEGQYQLYRALKFKRSDMLVKSDGPAKIKTVLDNLMRDEGGVMKVTNPSNNLAHLEFGGELNGYDVQNLEVVVYSAPPPNVTFELNLDNAEVAGLLRESESVSLPFELDATVWVDARDPSQGTKTIKLWKTTATIRRNLLWDSMATRPPINWLAKPNPVDYVPFSRSQFIIGQQGAYLAVIGDGTAKSFSIAHNLGQANGGDQAGVVAVDVRENRAGGRKLRDEEYTLRFVSDSELTIEFETAPAANSIAVVSLGYGPESAFAIHTHPIDQIKTVYSGGAVGESLRDILDDFNQRISRLENLIPRGVSLPSGLQKKKVIVPVVGEILPDIFLEGSDEDTTIASQIVAAQAPATKPPVAIANTEADDQRRALEAEIQKLKAEAEAAKKAAEEAATKAAEEFKQKVEQEQAEKPKKTITAISVKGTYTPINTTPFMVATLYPAMRGAKYPMLLRAVHSAAAQNVASVPSGFASGLFRNSGTSAILLPGGGGRKSQTISAAGLFAGDGRAYYAVRRSGSTNTYHPTEMERDLARVLIRRAQFPVGASLGLAWSTEFGFQSDSLVAGAGYALLVRATPIPDAATPPPTGENVGAIGQDVLLGAGRISLSRGVAESRKFSLTLKRPEGGRLTEFVDYGVRSIGPEFPEGDFLLTIRLEQWDVDDSTAAPAGQVSLLMPDTQITIEQL